MTKNWIKKGKKTIDSIQKRIGLILTHEENEWDFCKSLLRDLVHFLFILRENDNALESLKLNPKTYRLLTMELNEGLYEEYFEDLDNYHEKELIKESKENYKKYEEKCNFQEKQEKNEFVKIIKMTKKEKKVGEKVKKLCDILEIDHIGLFSEAVEILRKEYNDIRERMDYI